MSDRKKGREVEFRGQPLGSSADWAYDTRHTGDLYIGSGYYESPDGITEAMLDHDDEAHARGIEAMDRLVENIGAAGVQDWSEVFSDSVSDEVMQQALEKTLFPDDKKTTL